MVSEVFSWASVVLHHRRRPRSLAFRGHVTQVSFCDGRITRQSISKSGSVATLAGVHNGGARQPTSLSQRSSRLPVLRFCLFVCFVSVRAFLFHSFRSYFYTSLIFVASFTPYISLHFRTNILWIFGVRIIIIHSVLLISILPTPASADYTSVSDLIY